jgi:ABC-type glycerol-3-phosphate transport system substrate-binding protein
MPKIYAAFEKATGAKLNVVTIPADQGKTALLLKWQTGERPDLMYWFPDQANMSQVDPAGSLRDLSNSSFAKAQVASYRKTLTIDGGVRGVIVFPPSINGMWYNKPIYTALGLDAPKNYQDVFDDCTKLKTKQAADPTFFPYTMAGGVGYGSAYFPLLRLNGLTDEVPGIAQKLNSNQMKWTDPVILDAVTYAKKLFDDGCFDKATYAVITDEQQRDAAVTGKTGAMALDQGNLYQMATKYGKDVVDTNLGFATPAGPKSGKAYYGFGNWEALLLPKTGDAAREAGADAFLDFMAKNGQQMLIDAGFWPTLDGFTAPTTAPVPVQEAYKLLAADSALGFWSDLCCDVGNNDFAHMFTGAQTPAQYLQDMQTNWERSGKERKLPGF